MSDHIGAGVNLQTLYSVLRQVARDRRATPFTYTELSEAYARRTQVRFDPHGTWDMPLDTINKRLESAEYPPLSALVVTQETGMPGAGFWDTCARTRYVSRNPEARQIEYVHILKEVYDTDWPAELP